MFRLAAWKGMVTEMNDVFLERMVKKKKETKEFLIIAGVVVGITVVMFVGMILFGFTGIIMIPFFLTIGAFFGGYKLITMQNVEYEYSFTNGFLSVDKILNRASRKRLLSFECNTVEDIGLYSQEQARLQGRPFAKKLFASVSSAGTEKSWYIIVNTQKTGMTLLVFDPDEDLQEAVKKFIPRQLKFEKFGRN